MIIDYLLKDKEIVEILYVVRFFLIESFGGLGMSNVILEI